MKDIFYNYLDAKIFTKDFIREFTGERKRAIRLLIAHYFVSAFVNEKGEFDWAVLNLGTLLSAVESKRYDLVDHSFVEQVKSSSISFLQNNMVRIDESISGTEKEDKGLNDCVNFFIKNINNSRKTLFLYRDIEGFWDLNKLYKERDSNVKVFSHHWIDLQPFYQHVPIHTFPEYFAYQDLINIWNDTLQKYDDLSAKMNTNARDYRQKLYSFNTSLRTSLVAGVHFCEAYLYYLYYNFKHDNAFKGNRLINRDDVTNIRDKEIIEELLFIEFPGLEDELRNEYNMYKDTLEYRNAFVHISAFVEQDISRLQYLIHADIDPISVHLQNIADIVETIESRIAENGLGILFWRKMFEWPNFVQKRKNSNLKKDIFE